MNILTGLNGPYGCRLLFARALLDHRPVRNRCVLDDDDNAVLNDKAQIFPARLLHVVFVDDPHIAADARVFVDDRFLDRCVRADAQRNLSCLDVLSPVRPGIRSSPHPSTSALSITQPVSMRERMPMTERFTVHSLRMQPSPTIDWITLAVEQLRRRQIARPRVDRRLFIVKAERRIGLLGERQIGVVEGFDGSDIFPVVFEKDRPAHCDSLNDAREDFFAEIRSVRRLRSTNRAKPAFQTRRCPWKRYREILALSPPAARERWYPPASL